MADSKPTSNFSQRAAGASKRLARATFKGQEGSFFWLCERAIFYVREAVRAVNDYIQARGSDRS